MAGNHCFGYQHHQFCLHLEEYQVILGQTSTIKTEALSLKMLISSEEVAILSNIFGMNSIKIFIIAFDSIDISIGTQLANLKSALTLLEIL